MGVLDNYNFALSDVKTKIESNSSETVTSLNDAFNDANSEGFDPAYDIPSYNSLREFQNYRHAITVNLSPYSSYPSGYITHSGSSWSNVRSANLGSNIETPATNLISKIQRSGSGLSTTYEIIRSFISYDFSSIPVGASILNAYFLFKSISDLGKEIYIYESNPEYGNTLGVDDYNNFDLTKPLFENTVEVGSLDPNRSYYIEAKSDHYSNIESKFGSYIQMAILAEDDADDNEPTSTIENGWELDNDTYPPVLRITYVGS